MENKRRDMIVLIVSTLHKVFYRTVAFRRGNAWAVIVEK